MKKFLLCCITVVASIFSHAQLLSWTPDFPKDNDNITITADATKGNQGLLGFTGTVYVHTGVITNLSTSSSNWRYSKFTWGSTEAAALAIPDGNNKWKYTINNIRTFFNVPGGEQIKKIAILFRAGGCTDCQALRNSDGSDMYNPIYDNSLAVRFTQPPLQPTYIPIPEPINKGVGDNINLTAVANKSSTLTLFLNGTVIQTGNNVTSVSANPIIGTSGNQTLVAEANDGSATATDTLRFFVPVVTTIAPLPAGVRDGINYETDNTAVTLVFYAPLKNRISVVGEFPGSNWTDQSQYQMNKTPDENYWWIRITGLTAGTEYAFQYLVDGNLRIADPYAEKLLDPYNNNDQNIPSSTYPGLKPYPTGVTTGIVSILQTSAPIYSWQVNNFSRPDKRGLIIYELLVRDFIAAHDWKTLRDTLNYLKDLGINAIELMPFNEFEGNNSWGYNPDFYFAPDKYYGPKNTLKEFIDSCHKRGIAVIMDIAVNHSFGLSPMVQLYFDAANNRPAANNPWFNPTPKHPFNVGYDMNHESLATRYFTSRVVEHWLNEYKIDGFRFDLSKGFTQVNSCSTPNCDGSNDVNNWGNVDATRIAIWKRYYDTVQKKSSGAYVILEHFAANNEEIQLSDYGMLLWGNMNYNYAQASMGYTQDWNFEGGIFTVRGWNQPHLVTYMESHDEERIMYKNLQFGNSSGSYSIKDLYTALRRTELSAAFLLTIPGPKMIWQFGELGYDYSINTCENGTINNNCRLSPKPIRWDYLQTIQRKRLYDIYSSLLKLRFHPLYKDGFVSDRIDRNLAGGFKWLKLTSDTSNLLVLGNFDVVQQTGTVTFQNAGTWYDYLNGNTISATGTAQNITLQPGEFHVYLNRNVVNAVTTPVTNLPGQSNFLGVKLYPNPARQIASIDLNVPQSGMVEVDVINLSGQKIMNIFSGFLTKGNHMLQFERNKLAGASYMLRVQTRNKSQTLKFALQ